MAGVSRLPRPCLSPRTCWRRSHWNTTSAFVAPPARRESDCTPGSCNRKKNECDTWFGVTKDRRLYFKGETRPVQRAKSSATPLPENNPMNAGSYNHYSSARWRPNLEIMRERFTPYFFGRGECAVLFKFCAFFWKERLLRYSCKIRTYETRNSQYTG